MRFLLVGAFLLGSCNAFFSKDDDKEPLARVGEAYLYKDDVATIVGGDMSAQDSAFYVANYINTWATKQLLFTKAKINLTEEEQREFDRLVGDYRSDLFTRAYLDALVRQSQDTVTNDLQLQEFYNAEKENFKLTEKLVQLRFVELPLQFLNKEAVDRRINDFKAEDKKYLDSIAVQFKKLHFNDTVWVGASRLMDEIRPLDSDNVDQHLKKSQFFELRDSLGIYLGKVTNVLEVNDVAPLSYITPKIRQIILNKRRLGFIRKVEREILDEAIKTNEFEVYAEE